MYLHSSFVFLFDVTTVFIMHCVRSLKLKVKAKLGIVRQSHVNSGFNLIQTSNYLTSAYGNIEGASRPIHIYIEI